ncbi:amidohydrolase family protein [Aquimarina brevivitae]|uniref:Amidohydrolase family protein n=1 Tax=Aquimarina brevivitae TaxID=323412 RepID=A0A4Q7P135_9FLAO|nr:amidohydrolase family protein [Aquimarina brevivitae]RZS93415.1 amidohydrolase family protein [Aquimarina brevivitae]
MLKYWLVILSLLCIGCSQNPLPAYDLVITNTNILNIENGKYLKGSVFIQADTIAEIVSGKDLKKYTTAFKVDGTGKFVLPGFWDNHIHLRGGDSLLQENKDLLPLFIINGITTVRDAGGDLTLAIQSWQKEIKEGSLIGPTIYTAGPKIDGPDPTWAGSIEIDTLPQVNQALDSLQHLNVDFVKLYDSKISGDLYLKSIEEASKRGMITSGHMPFTVNLKETVNSGLGAVEHLYYILKGCSAKEKKVTTAVKKQQLNFWTALDTLVNTYDPKKAQQTFDLLNDHNVFVVPTLHIGDVLSELGNQNHQNDPYLQLIGPGIQKTYTYRLKSALQRSESATTARKKLDAFFDVLVKELDDANVQLLAGSDSGAFNSFVYPGVSLHQELQALQNAGLTPLKVLQASAYNGAAFLQKDSQYGSITTGKKADLVLLNSNPLKDIKNTRDIYRVVKNGKSYDPLALAEKYNCAPCFTLKN